MLRRSAVAAFPGRHVRRLIVRSLKDVEAAGNVHKSATGTWESRRYLLRKDGLGFSFHHTVLYEGRSTLIWYRNHVEAVMIVAGEGEIEVVTPEQKEGEGVVHQLKAGTMYALDGHERHYLRATTGDMHAICTFSPPVAGSEDHNDEGVYPAVGDDGVPLYEYGPEAVERLFKPPASLAQGSARPGRK